MVLRGLSFQPGGRIVNVADASGLLMAGDVAVGSKAKAPIASATGALSRQAIEWIARERLERSRGNLSARKELDRSRHQLVLERQLVAGRRIAGRLGAAALREALDSDLAGRLVNFEVSRAKTGEAKAKVEQRQLQLGSLVGA